MIVEELRTEKIDWRWKDTKAKVQELADSGNLVLTNAYTEPYMGLWTKTKFHVMGTKEGLASFQLKMGL